MEQLVLPTPHWLAAAGGPAAAGAAWQPSRASWSMRANRSRRQRAGATPIFQAWEAADALLSHWPRFDASSSDRPHPPN